LRGKVGLQLAIDLLLGLKLFQWQALFGTLVESVRSANRTDCSAGADRLTTFSPENTFPFPVDVPAPVICFKSDTLQRQSLSKRFRGNSC
jgi:hypothetical protein